MPTVPGRARNVGTASSGVRKRNRKTLSCMSCRARKLRCDRKQPACSNCLSRPEVESCEYSTAEGRIKAPANQNEALGVEAIESIEDDFLNENRDEPKPASLQSKLERLEGIIQKFMGESQAARSDEGYQSALSGVAGESDAVRQGVTTRTDSDIELAPSPQFMSRAGETLWATLLSELAEVRAHVRQSSPEPIPSSTASHAPTLLFGAGQSVSKEDILISIPSRHTCNKIIKRYFTSIDPALCFLHRPTFMEEYETFWDNPKQRSITWVALFYGVLRVAIQSWVRDSGEPVELKGKCQDLAALFRRRSAEAFILADYTRPQEYLVEGLLLHMYSDYSATRDFNPSVWVLQGTIARMAMRMGYHLHSQPSGSASPFQGEMRRRSWGCILQADIFFSFQLGLPSMLPFPWLRSGVPHNLNDEDFDPTSTELPPSLPASEVTDAAYLILKNRMAMAFAKALHELSQPGEIPYQRVLDLDLEIRGIYSNSPAIFQVNELPDVPVLEPHDLVIGLILTTMYNKTLCAIHSRHLEPAYRDPQFRYSRNTCLNSAMTILSFQRFQHQPFVVDGRITDLTRYQTSITIHDHFLAATMLCKGLIARGDEESNGAAEGVNSNDGGSPSREEMLETLDGSLEIFGQLSAQSAEARRACGLLSALMRSIRDSTNLNDHSRRTLNVFEGEAHSQWMDPMLTNANVLPSDAEGRQDQDGGLRASPLPDNFDMTELWGSRNSYVHGYHLAEQISVRWPL